MRKLRKMAWVGIVVVIVLALMTVQVYMKRGIQGRLKSSSDDIGDQYSVGNTSVLTVGGRSRAVQSGRGNSWTNTSGTIPEMTLSRKLIKNGEITLQVAHVVDFIFRLHQLEAKYSIPIVNSSMQSSWGRVAGGRIVFKVSPDNYEGIVQEIKTLGKVETATETTEDVTEEYVDLEARLSNAKNVHQRLLKVLEEDAKKVDDILKVEAEIARLGEEIERIAGKMKFIDRQVALSTITINYHEPQALPAWSLNIKGKLIDSCRTAAEGAVTVFNGILMFMIILLPVALWIVMIMGVVIIIRFIMRFMRRKP